MTNRGQSMLQMNEEKEDERVSAFGTEGAFGVWTMDDLSFCGWLIMIAALCAATIVTTGLLHIVFLVLLFVHAIVAVITLIVYLVMPLPQPLPSASSNEERQTEIV